MNAPYGNPGIASHVAVCAMCGAEVGAIMPTVTGQSVIRPCGHPANLKMTLNPRLRPRPV